MCVYLYRYMCVYVSISIQIYPRMHTPHTYIHTLTHMRAHAYTYIYKPKEVGFNPHFKSENIQGEGKKERNCHFKI